MAVGRNRDPGKQTVPGDLSNQSWSALHQRKIGCGRLESNDTYVVRLLFITMNIARNAARCWNYGRRGRSAPASPAAISWQTSTACPPHLQGGARPTTAQLQTTGPYSPQASSGSPSTKSYSVRLRSRKYDIQNCRSAPTCARRAASFSRCALKSSVMSILPIR